MSPFDFTSYRAYLDKLCATEGKSRGFRAGLARAAGCQASYLSQALGGKAHLTEDHLAGIAAHLSLPPEETDYLLLLLRFEKAGTEKLRQHLKARIQESRKEGAAMKNKVRAKEAKLSEKDLGLYASSWIPGAVHLLTSDPAHGTVDAITRRLSLPAAKVTETLHFLERIGLVQRSKQGWSYLAGSLHIPKASPWHSALQASRRELADRSVALGREGSLHFSSVFTLSASDLAELRRIAERMIEDSHKLIGGSGTDSLAAICVDVFEVV